MTIVVRRPPLTALWLAVSLLCSSALAASTDDALAALLRGQPDAAVTLLAGRSDAPSLALLARAHVGQAVFAPTPERRRQLYARSEAAARTALAADPQWAAAHVELANALALQLPGAGLLRATQVGPEIRRLFERATALDPGQARAWMGLGTWHAQALGLGGLVTLASGASEAAMRADHQRAITLEPNEVFFRLGYADSLLLLAGTQPRRAAALRREARAVLEAALTLTPQTYWQRLDQNTVRERLRALAGG